MAELEEVIAKFRHRNLSDETLVKRLKAEAPEHVDDLILDGFRVACRRMDDREISRERNREQRETKKKAEEYCRRHGIPTNGDPRTAQVKHLSAEGRKAFQAVVDKAEGYDRMVELLDIWQVDGKKLGDCTKSDLVKASREAKTAARQATEQAGVYTALAGILKDNETVRQCSKRREIINALGSLEQAA